MLLTRTHLAGMALLMASATAAATSAAGAASVVAQEDADPGLDAARDAFAGRRFGVAVRLLRRHLDAHPEDDRAWYLLVRTQLYRHDLDAAVATAEASRASLPDGGLATVALADVAFREARFDVAGAGYRRALELLPRSHEAHLGYARLLETESRLRSARQHIRQAASLSPDHPDVLFALARSEPDRERAAELLRRWAELATWEDSALLEAATLHAELVAALGERGRCELAVERDRIQIPLPRLSPAAEVSRHGLDVVVNGTGPIRTLLDTGSSNFLVLTPRAARRAGVERLSKGLMRAVGGSSKLGVDYGLARSVELGELRYTDCVVRIADTIPDAAGEAILGLGGLAGLSLTLDFPGETMAVAFLPGFGEDPWEHDREIDPAQTDAAAARILGDTLRVPITIAGKKESTPAETAYMTLDTGAQRTVLAIDLARRHGSVGRSSLHAQGLAGSARLADVHGVELRWLGTQVLTSPGPGPSASVELVAMDFEDLDWIVGARSGGVLGIDLLSRYRVEVDLRNGLVRMAVSARSPAPG